VLAVTLANAPSALDRSADAAAATVRLELPAVNLKPRSPASPTTISQIDILQYALLGTVVKHNIEEEAYK
jgi:hypothetical protein